MAKKKPKQKRRPRAAESRLEDGVGVVRHRSELLPAPSLPRVDAGSVRAARRSIARQRALAREAETTRTHLDRLLVCPDPRFAIHALGLGASDPTAVDRQAAAAATGDGRALVVALTASHRVWIRIVVGPLSETENEEWVDRHPFWISIPCGRLALHGGTFDTARALRAARRGADDEPYLEVVDVPPADYGVDLYTFIGSGGEGQAALRASGCDAKGGGAAVDSRRPPDADREGAWFRRTRRGEPFPDWLVRLLVADPTRDPGHEQQWLKLARKDAYRRPPATSERPYVDFLLHLRPSEVPVVAAAGSEVEYRPGTNPCWPERLPLGLPVAIEQT